MSALALTSLFAFGTWTIGQMAIAAVVVLGIIAVVYIAARAMGVPVPSWFIQILLVIVVVVVAVLAIKFLLTV